LGVHPYYRSNECGARAGCIRLRRDCLYDFTLQLASTISRYNYNSQVCPRSTVKEHIRQMPINLPSVHAILNTPEVQDLVADHGHTFVVEAIRDTLAAHRRTPPAEPLGGLSGEPSGKSSGEPSGKSLGKPSGKSSDKPSGEPLGKSSGEPSAEAGTVDLSAAGLTTEVRHEVRRRLNPRMRRLFNLTGTVLHTNLGRALLSEAAVEQVANAMRYPSNLEFDVESGRRGERDTIVENLLIELTGAEAATVVNNNAAAVLLTLGALASRREVIVSRGELVEIGGAFRIPDVMRGAQAKLIEVGTTNRTHKSDYENAISSRTAALMKVHTSNYEIKGFVASVPEALIAQIAHANNVPFIHDLGGGNFVDLSAYGLPKEPVVREALSAGADVVTFSGDKLLGGPQAGLIVGKRQYIDKIRKHPLKRALRVSKLTMAALEATLMAYQKPETLVRDLPTLRLLTRPMPELAALAERLLPHFQRVLGEFWMVSVDVCESQIGSGTSPTVTIPSMAIRILPARDAARTSSVSRLSDALRKLPLPVVGKTSGGAVYLDVRCLEDEAAFVDQLPRISVLLNSAR
jgi:L-seryl-tRNA(Ser) seleniumtransferase